MIKWGILGAGRIAEKFVSDFSEVKNGEVWAVGSRDLEKSTSFAGKFALPKAYGSYSQLLADNDIDIIYIATPHNFHFEQIKMCLNHNKHVLCEKPITVNAKQLAEIVELAKQKNRFVMEAMWTPFLPTIKKVQQWINDDRIGKIQVIQANFGFQSSINKKGRLFNPELAGGSLLDIGIYPLTIFEMLAQSEIKNLQSVAEFGDTGVDETLSVQIQYENGILAQMTSAFLTNLKNDAIIYGAKGHIRIPDFWMAKKAYLEVDDGSEIFSFNTDSEGYNFEIEAVNTDLLAEKIQNNVMPLSRSLKMMQLMDKIRNEIGLKYPFE